MPVSDGHIRAKDIASGEINSRVMGDIHSDNYDGSLTDPESNSGTSGWAIFKELGLVIANEGIIRGTIRAGQIIGGALQITGGGKLIVGDNLEDPLVELNEQGLFVAGGLVRAFDVQVAQAQDAVALPSGSTAEIATHTFTLPDWATSATVQATAIVRAEGGSGADGFLVNSQARINHVTGGLNYSRLAGGSGTLAVTVPHLRFGTWTTSTDGFQLPVSVYGSHTGTGTLPAVGSVWGLVIATRD